MTDQNEWLNSRTERDLARPYKVVGWICAAFLVVALAVNVAWWLLP